MPPAHDLVGQRFGRLVVVERVGSRGGRSLWRCRCDCGGGVVTVGASLERALTKSCGCLQAESARRCGALADGAANIKHRGTIDHPAEYHVWKGMVRRGTGKGSAKDRELYRGISICARWLSFANFIADMGPRPPGTSLDRTNNSLGYEPGNVRWATAVEQANNRRPRRSSQEVESERAQSNQQEATPWQQ